MSTHSQDKQLDMHTAASRLQHGQVIVYPTETYMALGCVITNIQSIERVFAIKKRPPQQPLPLIIADSSQLELLLPEGNRLEGNRNLQKLLIRLELFFWPGPLTVLFPAGPRVHPLISAGSGEVAVRISSHPQAKELASIAGPLVSSSANFSGEEPVIDPEDLPEAFKQAVSGWVTPRPKPSGGPPSTIVRPSPDGKTLQLLRQGAVPPQRLAASGFEIV